MESEERGIRVFYCTRIQLFPTSHFSQSRDADCDDVESVHKSGRLPSKFSMEVVLIDIPAFAECDGGAGKGSSFVVYVVRVAYQVRPSLLPPPSDVRARCCDAPALRTALTPSLSAPRYSPSLGRYSVVTRTSVR